MRTEQDLLAALGEREKLAPAPDAVLADVPQIAAQHRRRRATATAAAVTLAVAAVIAIPVLLIQRTPTDSGPATIANPPVGAATPSPMPLLPWHDTQYVVNSSRPDSTSGESFRSTWLGLGVGSAVMTAARSNEVAREVTGSLYLERGEARQPRASLDRRARASDGSSPRV